LVGLGLLSFSCATFVSAAAGSEASGTIMVSPSQAYTNETIENTITGFPTDYVVPAGAITLGGVLVPIPGVFGNEGPRPRTNAEGNVTFTTRVPMQAPFGIQPLKVVHFAGDGERTAMITVLNAEISFSVNVGSPNQWVTLSGEGFSPSYFPNGNGILGVHQITGQADTGITLNGVLLDSPDVIYPINLDSDGGLTARIRLPDRYIDSSSVSLDVKVIDDLGRIGLGVWAVKTRSITISPIESGRGSNVTVNGVGFMAAGGSSRLCRTVDIAYAGVKLTQVSPDATGSRP